MKVLLQSLLTISVLFLAAVFFSGCVNVIQKVKLNEDGSGTMSIRYWTNSSNVFGDELSGFGFTEEKVKSNYTSSNSEPSEIKIEKNVSADSLAMVTLNLRFNDINKLSDVLAFKKIDASFYEDSEGKKFKYVLLQDTVNAKKFSGTNEYLLYHEFDFPGEVIYTNGINNITGSKIYWKNTLADLINDVEMIATIKCK